jgi:2'-5' RNA ligase
MTGPITATSASADPRPEDPDALAVGVAVAVPDPFGAELTAWRGRFGDPRAVDVPAHITLLPPTRLTGVELIDVEDHLARAVVGMKPFRVRLAGTGTFRPVSPVVFMEVVEGGPTCDALQARVRTGPLSRRLSYEYHPHVTVAQDLDDEALDHAAAVLAGWSCEFAVEHLTLYHHCDGVWRPVSEIKLLTR